jgi:hypothetical protein
VKIKAGSRIITSDSCAFMPKHDIDTDINTHMYCHAITKTYNAIVFCEIPSDIVKVIG